MSGETYAEILTDLVDSYPNAIYDIKVFKALVSDYFPQDKVIRNLLISCVEEDIPSCLKSAENIDQKDINILVKKLEVYCGYSRDNSELAISIWLRTFGLDNKKEAESLIDYFKEKNLKVVDNRSSGGALWVIGDESTIGTYIDEVSRMFNISGRYGSGKATGYKPGWWTKSEK